MVVIAIAIGVFLLDYFVKKLIDQRFRIGEQKPILGGHVVIEKFYNRGATLGFLKDAPTVLKWMNRIAMGIISVVFGWLVARNHPSERVQTLGIAMIAGGGFSNLFDRETKGHVVDYFWFSHKKPKKRRVIFNISDFCIFIGALLSVLGRKS